MDKTSVDMDIRIKNYILRQCTSSPTRFDLYQEVQRKKKDTADTTYSALNEVGFGYTLSEGINMIIHMELQNYNIIVELKDYLDQYREIKNEITKQLN